jgi:hypothetical protein
MRRSIWVSQAKPLENNNFSLTTAFADIICADLPALLRCLALASICRFGLGNGLGGYTPAEAYEPKGRTERARKAPALGH